MPKPDRPPKGLPADPVRALRARELLAELRPLVTAQKWKDAAPRSHALVQIAPDMAEGHELMGMIALGTGAPAIAETCFERAVGIGPATGSRLFHWAQALLALNEPAAAERVLHRALLVRPDDPDILVQLGEAQLSQGRTDDALKSLRRALKKRPDNHFAAHLVSALTTAGTPDRAYVTSLFDDYAGIFEEHLTQKLGYRVPEALVSMLAYHLGPKTIALDLGCGTGLVAEALAGKVEHIDGIDLAPKMVEQARARGRYRHLASGDCIDVMASAPDFIGPYDLVCAADVFIYMGALETVFDTMLTRLAPGGLIAFSVETTAAQDIEIRASGRFAHAPDYIDHIVKNRGLALLADQTHTIRQEQERPIAGHLYLLQTPQNN